MVWPPLPFYLQSQMQRATRTLGNSLESQGNVRLARGFNCSTQRGAVSSHSAPELVQSTHRPFD
jgi:hypothetical protein